MTSDGRSTRLLALVQIRKQRGSQNQACLSEMRPHDLKILYSVLIQTT